MSDPRPFCDHGHWKPPCSKERHDAIVRGVQPYKNQTPAQEYETKWHFAILSSRVLDDGTVVCSCCRLPFIPRNLP